MVLLAACTRSSQGDTAKSSLILCVDEVVATRAVSPEETLISDCNILIFNPYGDLEERVFIPSRSLRMRDGRFRYDVRLLRDVPYTVLCAFNMGYALPAMTLPQAREYRFFLAYPDEFTHGLPMVALCENTVPGDSLHLKAKRLVARIDLEVHKDEVPEGVVFKVTDVEVTGCPSSATLFPGSVVRETFSRGYVHTCDGFDHPMSLYVLENLGEGTALDIRVQYQGPDFNTPPGDKLHYRIPLPPLERNFIYPIIVKAGGTLPEACPPPDACRGRGPQDTSSAIAGRRRLWEGPE